MKTIIVKRVLCAVCLAFLVSSSAYAQADKAVKVDVLTKTTTSWNGATLPAYLKGQPQVTVLKIVIPPKFKLPVHEHPEINAGVLLKGQLTVKTMDNKILHLKAGDPIVECVNTWHYGINEGNKPAEIIVFYAGIKGKPITIKK